VALEFGVGGAMLHWEEGLCNCPFYIPLPSFIVLGKSGARTRWLLHLLDNGVGCFPLVKASGKEPVYIASEVSVSVSVTIDGPDLPGYKMLIATCVLFLTRDAGTNPSIRLQYSHPSHLITLSQHACVGRVEADWCFRIRTLLPAYESYV